MAKPLAQLSEVKLKKFDGKPVLGTGIKITNAGDGLSDALAVDPQEFGSGEKVYVVLECEVTKILHDPVKDTNGFLRLHTLKAGTATIVDEDFAGDVLDKQRLRFEEAAGVHRLQLGDELERQHRASEHEAGLVEGCPMCDEIAANT